MNFKKMSETYMEEFIEKAERILRIPSVFETSGEFPFGNAIDQALTEMLAIGEDDGFTVKNVDGYAGHIQFGTGKELIGILGHLDVVPAGKGWTSPPFEPTIREGNLYARGAQDDKGPVMAAYIAMKMLKDHGFQPKKRVRLIVGTDEERDWKGIDYYFQKEEMPEVGFTPDASFPVIHAEKGLLDVYMDFTMAAQENSPVKLLEVRGGDRLNMVPDEAEAMIAGDESLADGFQLFLNENNLEGEVRNDKDHLHFHIKGKSVHASKPETGVNAIVYMLKYLSTLPLGVVTVDKVTSFYRAFSACDGKGLNLSASDDISGSLTLNLGSIQLIPGGKCVLGMNMRYPVTSNYDGIIEKLETFCEREEGKLQIYDHLKALHIEEDHPFVQTLLQVYNDTVNEVETVKAIGGATYARSLEAGVAYGALFKDSPDTAHQADEHVRLEDMKKAIEIYARAIYELTKS